MNFNIILLSIYNDICSLIIREMKIKTTVKYHFTPVRMAVINKSTNNKCRPEWEKKENLYTLGGIPNWCSHCGKQYETVETV